MRLQILFLIIFSIFFIASPVSGQNSHSCGIEAGKPLQFHYGPFDFTNPKHADRFPVVLNRHFTNEIRLLTAHKARGDLDYTLKAIPNHIPALASMAKLQLRWKKNKVTHDDVYTGECYFERAIYFAPMDMNVKYLYAIYLHQLGKYESAEKLYLQVLESNSKNIEAHYNLGLLLIKLGKFDTAKVHAKLAYAGNFPLEGLKKKLIKLGVWE